VTQELCWVSPRTSLRPFCRYLTNHQSCWHAITIAPMPLHRLSSIRLSCCRHDHNHNHDQSCDQPLLHYGDQLAFFPCHHLHQLTKKGRRRGRHHPPLHVGYLDLPFLSPSSPSCHMELPMTR
jgi:hypothetical protein